MKRSPLAIAACFVAIALPAVLPRDAAAAQATAAVDFSNIQVSVEATWSGMPTFQWLSSNPNQGTAPYFNSASTGGFARTGAFSCCINYGSSDSSPTAGVSASVSGPSLTGAASASSTSGAAASAFTDGSQSFNYANLSSGANAYRAFSLSGPGIVYFTIPYALSVSALTGESASSSLNASTQVFGNAGLGSGFSQSLTDSGPDPSQSQSSSFMTLTFMVTGTAPFNVGYLYSSASVSTWSTVAAVPEPHEWAMFALGLVLVGWMARRSSAASEAIPAPA